jgi:hypothetical protein
MAVCPYSHPDNLMHNTVRLLIKHSELFRRLAPLLDDLLYGGKPKPLKQAAWQKVPAK